MNYPRAPPVSHNQHECMASKKSHLLSSPISSQNECEILNNILRFNCPLFGQGELRLGKYRRCAKVGVLLDRGNKLTGIRAFETTDNCITYDEVNIGKLRLHNKWG